MAFGSKSAFTLAELLIALSILGIIATFTIPKILRAQQAQEDLSKAKEVAGMISGAYLAYKAANDYRAPSSMLGSDLIPYLNYVQQDSTGTVDLRPSFGVVTCGSGGWVCLKLHNGGTLMFHNVAFGGTSSTNAINIGFDPDSTYSGSAAVDAPGQGIEFWLYYNGKVRTAGSMENPTGRQGGDVYLGPGYDPSWFSW